MRRLLLTVPVVALAVALSAPAQPPELAPPPRVAVPHHVDDEEVYDNLMEKLKELAKAKKCLAHEKLLKKFKPGVAKVTPARPGEKALTPEEVYKAAVPGVFIVGSVYPDVDNPGDWLDGTYATAWVLAADGVLVTNWHVFEELEKGEVFGAADRDGNVYPMTDFLGGDKVADVAIIRIAAKGLTPLPVAPTHAEVGSWVGLISHPGDLFYMYTQGHVTRYSTNNNDDGKREKWMGISAEYASGSSCGPVLNKYGAVVGMAALTLSIDASDGAMNPARRKSALGVAKRGRPQDEKKKDDKPVPKDPPKPEVKPEPNPKGSTLQMVVKMAVPAPVLLKWVGK
jgi:serine protease Do